jgi:hypothetical protein
LHAGLCASHIPSAIDNSSPPLDTGSVSVGLISPYAAEPFVTRVFISVTGELKSMSLPRAFVEEKCSKRGKKLNTSVFLLCVSNWQVFFVCLFY